MNSDPYSVLGVSPTATQEEIRNAYRKLAKSLHPDLNPGNKQAEQRFKEVAAAYELIGDEKKRKAYEESKAQRAAEEEAMRARQNADARHFYYETQGPEFESGYSQGFSFEDLFGEALRGRARGGARTGGGPRTQPGPIPGEDEYYRMDVELGDIIKGAERDLTLPNGKHIRVKIPAGVAEGMKLRFAGQGGPGFQGGPPGDAYVELSIKPSAEFKREGNDLEMELPITLSEAVNGGEIRVPTLDGNVMLRVPGGISSGTRLRIRGKGIPVRGKSGERGNLYVKTKIVLPSGLDDELKKAVLEFEKRHPYDPRSDLGSKAA
ncbi:MAG: DnaJ C-terminal domain-containing protein [Bdellovibrionia bacterium]